MFPCNSGPHRTLVGEGLAVESTLHPLDITQKDLLITLDNLLDIRNSQQSDKVEKVKVNTDNLLNLSNRARVAEFFKPTD